MDENPYQMIKRTIAQGIASGQWRSGDVLPSEHALCRSFAVSRMTVNRAMRELANENVIRRVPGLGSFVAEKVAQSDLVEIRNIADEIGQRGHRHDSRVLALEAVAADDAAARAFAMEAGARLFHSLILHLEDGVPLQVEDRLVDPAGAPFYLAQDFTVSTPNEYLTSVAPLTRAEHRVRAIAAPAPIAGLLRCRVASPCLLVTRRTWSGPMLASLAQLYHTGPGFELVGGYKNPN